MQSRWDDSMARQFVERYRSWGEDIALRVYTSRLLGAEPDLVLHGGGNTSVKSRHTNRLGREIPALYVKGSGWNLDTLEPEGLPGLDLEYLRSLRVLETLDDAAMVEEQRTHLFNAAAPTPSVETLLHAFLPPKFIDHSHANAVLAVTNRPDGDALARNLFGDRVGIVPYVMPGFRLARCAAQAYEDSPGIEGLVLLKHGLFTWGQTARESYERHIRLVAAAEEWLAANRRPWVAVAPIAPLRAAQSAGRVAPLLRGRMALPTGEEDRPWRRRVLEWRATEEILAFAEDETLRRLSQTAPLTPDHIIRTKARPMLVEPVPAGEADAAWIERIQAALDRFAADYRAYFERGLLARGPRKSLDPLPNVVLIPGVGMFTTGSTRKDARMAADIYEHTIRTKRWVLETGRYEGLPELDLFDMEYWGLEQAKLGKEEERPLARQIAVVTGAAGAIGSAIAECLLEAGAHVALMDRDSAALGATSDRLAGRFGGAFVEAIPIDVTDEESTREAFATAARRLGGVDIAVPNAGIAFSAAVDELELADWNRVQAVNSAGTFLTVREAARLMKRQATGGNIVIVSSKNVLAPGKEFAAYSASKAAATQLGRIAAMELAESGIRVNLVAPDAVFGTPANPSGLWKEVGPGRAKAQGVEADRLEEFYRDRNLLRTRITGRHVGRAVVFFASGATPTTGAILPVDGGVVGAFPR